MVKKSVANQEIKKLVFVSDNSWVLHFGKNYEDLVLRSIRDKVPVIQILSVNGNTTALPLDRAKYLLDKFYKMTNKPFEEQGKLEEPVHQPAPHLFTESAITPADYSHRKMAANGY